MIANFAVQPSVRILFTKLFCSWTTQQPLIQHNPFYNWEYIFGGKC